MHKKLTNTTDIFNTEGALLTSEPMWRHTTFGVGGPADLFAVPAGEEDLHKLLRGAREAGMPVFILGGGSNLLVADAGIRGLVIDMRAFDEYSPSRTIAGNDAPVSVTGETVSLLTLGSGLDISEAAWRSGSAGLAGLHFFFGMPGSIGGAVWMNARCYDGEISQAFIWADVMDFDGDVRRISRDEGGWDYKASPFQSGGNIILRSCFAMSAGKPADLKEFMMQKRDDRIAKGHFRAHCAGSAFKNNREFGSPSGVLIDRCGLKGLRVGGAAVSDWHGNIIVNDKGASAGEIRELLARVSDTVERETGFRMETEVQPVGDWPA